MNWRTDANDSSARRAFRWGAWAFIAIAAYFLWTEHRAHVAGVLPYLLLLACPIIHLLMHRGHGRREDRDGHGAHQHHREEGGAQ